VQNDTRRARSRARRRQTAVLTAIGAVGELLLTAGVFVFLYLGWSLFVDDAIAGASQTNQAIAQSQSWQAEYAAGPVVVDVPKSSSSTGTTAAPAFSGSPSNAQIFATLVVPRFGADWSRPIAEGVGTTDVLNTIGLGHYPGTSMPGAVGNFAIAGHRTTYGSPFHEIQNLNVGDSIYVETADGWYRYVFRAHEYVPPTGIEVLAGVPNDTGASPTDRVLTMTSCNPLYSAAERYVAYAVYDSWTPRSAGPPAEIAALYGKAS